KITLVNLTNAVNNVVVNFINQAGNVVRTQPYALAPAGTVRLATAEVDRYGPTVTQWAVVGADTPLAANAFFEYIPSAGKAPNAPGGAGGNRVGFNDGAP